jgi:hypothetical protein
VSQPLARRLLAEFLGRWHLAMLMALIHAGSAELQSQRVPQTDAEAALVATVLGAVSASPRV